MPRGPSWAACAALLLSATLSRADDVVSVQSSSYRAGDLGVAPLQTFNSSSITPPRFNYLAGHRESEPGAAQGPFTCLTYWGGTYPTAPAAPIIFDTYTGEIVWSGQLAGGNDENVATDLKVQRYKGEPVLTYWQGATQAGGFGLGWWTILGQDYNQITTVRADNQTASTSDFHEMTITNDDTALVETWPVVGGVDLSGVNATSDAVAPSTGYAYDCVFQEVDIESGDVMFSWASLDHVPASHSYMTLDGDAGTISESAFDYCHLNSIDKDRDGNYLVSLRHTCGVYYINGTTGDLIWTLGSVNSSFESLGDTAFYYQHHARFRSEPGTNPRQITLFDNGARDGDDVQKTARGMLLALNTDAMTVNLTQEWLPSFDNVSESQGNVDYLVSGNVLIGWGQEPYASEYSMNGTLVWDVQFGATSDAPVMSYRAHRAPAWRGHPTTLPSLALNSSTESGHQAAYVSWNGATEVDSWKLLGSTDTLSSPRLLASASRTGFETNMTFPSGNAYVFAAAFNAAGACLSASESASISTGGTTGLAGSCATVDLLSDESAGTSLNVPLLAFILAISLAVTVPW